MQIIPVSSAFAAPGAAGSANVVDIVAQASPVVIITMLLLLFFSVTTWTIIFIKWRQLGRAKKLTHAFVDAFWDSGSLSQINADLDEYEGSPAAEIFRVGYAELGSLSKLTQGLEGVAGRDGIGGLENLRRALSQASRAESGRLGQYLTFLATTGNTAPFVGLFGTVVGIMNAFQGIGLQGSASLATVAPGISEALVATAAGLAAAIPAVVAYNHYLAKVRGLEAEMNSFASDFLNLVERDALRKASARVSG